MKLPFEKQVHALFCAASRQRMRWDSLLQSAYDLTMPMKDSKYKGTAQQSGPKNEAIKIFDATGAIALAEKAQQLHGQLFPAYDVWQDFEVPKDHRNPFPPDVQTQIDSYLLDVRTKFHAAIDVSNFHTEISPALSDALISVGALDLNQDTPMSPFDFSAVPVSEFSGLDGASGFLDRTFRERSVPLYLFEELYGSEAFNALFEAPNQLTYNEREFAEKPIQVVEAVVPIGHGGPYRYSVHAFSGVNRNEFQSFKTLFAAEFDESPRIAFRYGKASGESMGRGPVLNVLPFIKLANKTVELILKNASIAVTGIWQADDDGVLNPSNIKLVPGTIVTKAVGSAGLQPLQSPGRFDVSELVLNDVRGVIQRAIGSAPPIPAAEEGDRRTAYEYGVRVGERAELMFPTVLRLVGESAAPIARRGLDILMSPFMRGSRFAVEPLTLGGNTILPRPRSPIIREREKAQTLESHSALLSILSGDPETVQDLVAMRRYYREFLLKTNFSPDFFRTKSEVDERNAEKVQAQQSQMGQLALESLLKGGNIG